MQWEKLHENSKNSSRPPSSDNPYNKPDLKEKENTEQQTTLGNEPSEDKDILVPDPQSNQDGTVGASPQKRAPGHQPGVPSQWRSTPLVASEIVPHYPDNCTACSQTQITAAAKPYMGYYVLELERFEARFQVICQLHHYYQATCECGHISRAAPGVGYVSQIPGRSKDLKRR